MSGAATCTASASSTISRSPTSTRRSSSTRTTRAPTTTAASSIRRKGQHTQAIDDFSKAISLAPNATEPFNARGLSYLAISDSKAALDDFNEVVKRDPKSYEGWTNQGLALEKLGETPEGVRRLRPRRQPQPELRARAAKACAAPPAAAAGRFEPDLAAAGARSLGERNGRPGARQRTCRGARRRKPRLRSILVAAAGSPAPKDEPATEGQMPGEASEARGGRARMLEAAMPRPRPLMISEGNDDRAEADRERGNNLGDNAQPDALHGHASSAA